MNEPDGDITKLLARIREGDSEAFQHLVDAVYESLRREASRLVRSERDGHTLDATAVVHEVVLRFLEAGALGEMPNRAYFFGAAARAMRRVLVDHARRRNAAKRGGGWSRLPLDDVLDDFDERGLDLLDLSAALDELEELSPRLFEIVHLRWFGGFGVSEIADMQPCSVSKVESDQRRARAFLLSRMSDDDS